MKKLAIVYDTVSGSTAEMGEILRDSMQDECEVVSMPMAKVTSLAQYDAVIIGSPMRFGAFTSRAKRFIQRNRSELERKKVAYFFSMLYVVRIAEENDPEPSLYVDPGLTMSTIRRKSATAMDRTHSLGFYGRKRRKCAPKIRPVSVAYLKGRLNLRKLPLEARLFMRIVTALTTKEQEGEFLNPSSVRSWAASLRRALA
jgi:menaquinone-dependent protoporphyrinogen IX oxidase